MSENNMKSSKNNTKIQYRKLTNVNINSEINSEIYSIKINNKDHDVI